MSSKRLFSLFLSCLLLSTLSCKDDCDSDFREPIISIEEPVIEGNDLILVARGDAEDSYKWKGPNELEMEGKIINVGPANLGMSGLYTVEVSRSGCGQKSSTKEIEISTLSPPCFQDVFEIMIDKYPNIQATNTICGFDSLRGAFTVNYSSLFGSFYVIFPGFNPPQYDQTYLAAGESDSLKTNEVRVEIYTGEQPNLKRYLGLNGNVYCKLFGNSLEIIVCDLPCIRSDGLVYVTGRINCNI